MEEKGQAISWGWIQVGRHRGIGYTTNVDVEDVKACLIADATRELPPGARFELRRQHPSNHGRTHGMAWYWCSGFANHLSWEGEEFKLDPLLGLPVARLTTKAAP